MNQLLARLKCCLCLTGLLAALAACATAPAPPVPTATAVPIQIAATVSNPSPTATISATATTRPRPSPLPATAMPTTPPTTTPLPLLTIHVPEQWQDVAQKAFAATTANDDTPTYSWQLADELVADLHLVRDGDGIEVGRIPLALAVPFALPWDETTLADAQAIVANGHAQATVVPWPELPPGSKALRVEGLGPADEDYPFQEIWSLVAKLGKEEAAAVLAGQIALAWPQDPIHLLAVGDIMLDRRLGDALRRGEIDLPFAGVVDILRAADITTGNMESALGDSGQPENKRYPFRAPPQAAAALGKAGFDIVSLANNHALDYGPQALLQGIELLQAAGVRSVGAGADAASARAPQIVQHADVDIAFLSYVNVPVEGSTGFDTTVWTATASTPGLAWANPVEIKVDVQAANALADLVVVLLHSGREYQAAPSEEQQAAAYAAVDAGADLVIGHHAHILQGVEWYGDGVIVYGTGNFAFDIDGSPETALFHIWLDERGVREIHLQPAIIEDGGQPRLVEAWLAPGSRNRVYELSALLGN